MSSEKFKFLRDEFKLREAKRICENAGYKVTESETSKITEDELMDKLSRLNIEVSDITYEDGYFICDIPEIDSSFVYIGDDGSWIQFGEAFKISNVKKVENFLKKMSKF